MRNQLKLPLIIGITGPIRAGKSTAAEYLSNKYGYISAPNVRVLKSILNALNLPLTRENLVTVGDTLFEDLGKEIIARARVAQVTSTDNHQEKRFVIDGIRYPEELEVYSTLNGFVLLSIDADDQIRLDRTVKEANKTKDGSPEMKDFLELNKRQSEQFVRSLMEQANAKISNNGCLTTLKDALDNAMISITG